MSLLLSTVSGVLHLYAAERIEPLASRLAQVLAETPCDPMRPEWIAVPSMGMRRWLQLQLARELGASSPGAGDGIAAHMVMTFPAALRDAVLAAEPTNAAGIDLWHVDRLAWGVHRTLVDHRDDELVGSIAPPSHVSLFGRAQRVAQLFDRYHVHRPAMVRQWASGADVDALGRPLPPHLSWQPHIWRLVRSDIGLASPPETAAARLDAARSGTASITHRGVELPQRLVLFGLTQVYGGAGLSDVISAVARHRELHLFQLRPSAIAATRLRTATEPAAGATARLRSDDTSAALVNHPLLRSWGRMQHEAAVVMNQLAPEAATDQEIPFRVGVGLGETSDESPIAGDSAATLLHRVQSDIRLDQTPDGSFQPSRDDRSLQFHACYGAARQVEVLRDAILHLLADEELDLSEEDIVVLCPALDRFAPLLEPIFGASAPDSTTGNTSRASRIDRSTPALRYRVADRSITTSNPLLAALSSLLDLVRGRFDAPAVLDFMSLAPVRARFDFTDDSLARIGEWVIDTQVCWGLTEHHRESFGVPAAITTNSWQAAVDQLMMGTALHQSSSLALGDVAPFDVGAGAVGEIASLAELMWRLSELEAAAHIDRTIDEWVEVLHDASTALFAASHADEWQLEGLHRLLGNLVEASLRPEPSTTPLTFDDLRKVLSETLDQAPGRPDFFRGGITITSMRSLRSIPFRAVCLLGMDQEAFGLSATDGDDLVAMVPMIADPDPRAEARQSLLEAILSARDCVLVFRDGHDVRTNAVVPPAVAVAELIDTLVATVHPDHANTFRKQLEIEHPRQPFDERCFGTETDGPQHLRGPWSFDPIALDGALARRRRSHDLAPFLPEPLSRDSFETIQLEQLQRFMKHPVKTFLEQRLGLRLPRERAVATATFPMEIVGLDGWRIGNRLLEALLDGRTVDEWHRVERRLGTLPPLGLGDDALGPVIDVAQGLVAAADAFALRRGPAENLQIDVTLGDGTRVRGTVAGQLDGPRPGPARIAYTQSKADQRVASWLDLMALVATDPSIDWRAVGAHKNNNKQRPVKTIDLTLASRDAAPGDKRLVAVQALEVAVDLYRRGMSEPLPLFAKLSPKVHLGTHKAEHWQNFVGLADGDDDANAHVFGRYTFHELMAIPALPTDPGGPNGRGDRVERFAHALWDAIEDSNAIEEAVQ